VLVVDGAGNPADLVCELYNLKGLHGKKIG